MGLGVIQVLNPILAFAIVLFIYFQIYFYKLRIQLQKEPKIQPTFATTFKLEVAHMMFVLQLDPCYKGLQLIME